MPRPPSLQWSPISSTEWLATRAADYDPLVLARIEGGVRSRQLTTLAMLHGRAALVRAMDGRLIALDGLVLPTTPIVAPTIAGSFDEPRFQSEELTALAQSRPCEQLRPCAISLPLPARRWTSGRAMLVARNGQDPRLFRMAAASNASSRRETSDDGEP